MNNKSPLIIPAFLWALGIIVGKIFTFDIGLISILFLIFSFLFLIKGLRIFSLFTLIFLLAILRWQLHTYIPKNSILSVIENHSKIVVPIRGKIVSEVTKTKRGFRFILRITKIEDYNIKGNIIFNTFQNGLEYGDIIQCKAKIKKIPNNANPGNFDYKEYLYSKKIYAKAYPLSFIKVIDYQPNFFIKRILSAKKFIRKRINKRFHRFANFTKAIVIAEKNNLTGWKTSLSQSGLSHLLAVSGLHIAILSLIIFTILKIFILNRTILYSSLILILFAYGFITNWPPSVIRAVTMIILYLLAKIIQRKPNPNNILAATLLIATIINPNQLFSAGFQMSFLAVLTLFNINAKIKLPFKGKITTFLERLFTVMLYSFLLNLFLSPITMFHFHSINMNGVISNIFGIPMLGFILPLALLVIFLPFPFFIPYQYSFYFFMLIFEKIVSFVQKLPFFYNFIHLTPIRFFSLIILLLLFFSFKEFFKKIHNKIIISILAFSIAVFPHTNENFFKFIFFNLDNADASLIISPNKKAILINCGPSENYYNRFERTILPYLQENGISKLDKLIITGSDIYNYGGIIQVIKNIKVSEIILPSSIKNFPLLNNIKNISSIKIVVLKDSLKFGFQDSNIFIINNQNSSLSIKFNIENFSAIFIENPSDLTAKKIFKNITLLKLIKLPSQIKSQKEISSEICYINLSNRRQKNKITKEILSKNIFLSSIDGALILKTNGKKLDYYTLLTECQKTLNLKKK